jgi:hypothetical protein
MHLRLFLFVMLLGSCARQDDRPQSGIDTAAFGVSLQRKPEPPTPEEVAHSRGGQVPDRIDSLIAKVVGMDAEFGEGDSDPPNFYFSGRNDTAFIRLAVIPAAVPRLVDCLAWDRRSRTTWHGAPVLVGAVCGHVLIATPYVQKRNHSDPWIDYRDPTIDELRAAQRLWLSQLRRDPTFAHAV